MLDQTTLAYTAGLIDGEGTIGIGHSKPNYRRRNNYFSYVSAVNSDKKLIEFLHTAFGGGIYGPYEGKGNRKETWVWRLHGPASTRFVTLIRPYLQSKAAQAWVALEFRAQCSWGHVGSRGLSPEEAALREGYFQIMKALNKRGR